MSSLNIFKSTDAAAPVLTGEVGKVPLVLDECLVLKRCFSSTGQTSGGDGINFVDNSAEARLQGGTAFTLFQGPTIDDGTFFGLQVTFSQVKLKFTTAGVGGTFVWEFWNGTAWATLTVTDGTSGLTVNGTVSFTKPGTWASKTVNGVASTFWIRVRCTATPSTNPTLESATITGWTVAFAPNANNRAYQQGAGNSIYFVIQDDGNTWATGTPSTAVAKECLARGYETQTAYQTGVGPWPTVTQLAQGIIIRKATAAGSTARPWILAADDKTLVFFILSGDTTNVYQTHYFGEFFSVITGDLYRNCIIGQSVANSGISTDVGAWSTIGVGVVGHYVDRPYTGAAGALNSSKWGSGAAGGTPRFWQGYLATPNPSDSLVYVNPVWVGDGSAVVDIRGRLRGVWQCHQTLADGDIFGGSGALAGKTWLMVKGVANQATDGIVIETSDTWETNSS